MPRGVPSFSSPVASPTTSKTAPTREPELLNLSIPGSFELDMPDIAQWFAENPPRDAGI